jgi:hypothetical protein
MLAVRNGQLTAGDFHPIRLAALSAAPNRTEPSLEFRTFRAQLEGPRPQTSGHGVWPGQRVDESLQAADEFIVPSDK